MCRDGASPATCFRFPRNRRQVKLQQSSMELTSYSRHTDSQMHLCAVAGARENIYKRIIHGSDLKDRSSTSQILSCSSRKTSRPRPRPHACRVLQVQGNIERANQLDSRARQALLTSVLRGANACKKVSYIPRTRGTHHQKPPQAHHRVSADTRH